MESPLIYTIGYGNRIMADFVNLLSHYNIDFLIDVRSRPYSKHNPPFTRESLRRTLAESGVKYVFMGDTLGGQPSDPTCYTDGKVDYAKCSTKDFYNKGISRLRTAWQKELHVALMCSESKPQDCHRSKLIGETLTSAGIAVAHIDEQGELKAHEQVIRILQGDQLSFFESGFTSRKRYLTPSEGDENY